MGAASEWIGDTESFPQECAASPAAGDRARYLSASPVASLRPVDDDDESAHRSGPVIVSSVALNFAHSMYKIVSMSPRIPEDPPEAAVKAMRGTTLRCRGWRQEGLLRMLENTLENAEKPKDLIVYGGSGRAARDWNCFRAIVACLRDLADDETLVVQSGKPVARFPTWSGAPRVLIANTNLVGQWATWSVFRELESRGLIMYGQYTAGDWQYIGQQGVLQSTYETLSACAHTHFDGDLRGRLVLTSGLGAMSGAQPLAVRFHGAVALVCEVDIARAERRHRSGYLDHFTVDPLEALTMVREALDAFEPRSIGLIGNAAELLPWLIERDVTPDVVTDQTSAHDLRTGYVPHGMALVDALRLRSEDGEAYEQAALASIRIHVEAMLEFQKRGSVVFEYGNAIRQQAAKAGLEGANGFPGFVQEYMRPSFCEGRGACRWIALSGDPDDIARLDEAMLHNFTDDPATTSWIKIAREYVPHQGLPARTAWLRYGARVRFGLMVNRMVADGELSAPVAMTRDHLDCGSVAQPTRETEGMLDGTDAVADWPLLNALLNASGGAELVAIHQGGGSGMGGSISAGMTIVIDGTPESAAKIERVLRTDPGIGVIRHADAGYEISQELIGDSDLVAPMIEEDPSR